MATWPGIGAPSPRTEHGLTREGRERQPQRLPRFREQSVLPLSPRAAGHPTASTNGEASCCSARQAVSNVPPRSHPPRTPRTRSRGPSAPDRPPPWNHGPGRRRVQRRDRSPQRGAAIRAVRGREPTCGLDHHRFPFAVGSPTMQDTARRAPEGPEPRAERPTMQSMMGRTCCSGRQTVSNVPPRTPATNAAKAVAGTETSQGRPRPWDKDRDDAAYGGEVGGHLNAVAAVVAVRGREPTGDSVVTRCPFATHRYWPQTPCDSDAPWS
ncbi:hypothetical protein SCALM49S_07771 [Streptomyces californicus]